MGEGMEEVVVMKDYFAPQGTKEKPPLPKNLRTRAG